MMLSSECCVEKNIRPVCRSMLCSTSTWQHFNPDQLINCYDSLDQVFPCLAGKNLMLKWTIEQILNAWLFDINGMQLLSLK